MPYLSVMTPKTYLRLKKTNPKLLKCHLCRKDIEAGQEVAFNAGAQRKKYHAKCATQVNIEYETDERYTKSKAEYEESLKVADQLKTVNIPPTPQVIQ